MPKICLFFFLMLQSAILFSQVPVTDTIQPAKGDVKNQLKEIKKEKIILHSDSTGNEPAKTESIDTTKTNKYNDLLNDDPEYNKKYPVWKPALQVVTENVVLNLLDRSVLNLEFSKVTPKTWGHTMNAGFPWNSGWEWDQDRFGNNFFSHPMMGSFYFNAARSNGYNFWQSTPFVFAGSYMWKIFGENGVPEREDLINTTFDGILLGEILYRISSNILDDRTTGRERVFREIAAGLVDPIRGLNRLFQGKSYRRTNKEVYQKEPINIAVYGGVHTINDAKNSFYSGQNSVMFDFQFDYGNPFEVRPRKPFDFFKFKVELNFDVGRKIVDNITGYGILAGKNMQWGNLAVLLGAFQYYDYFDTKSFELATTGFGGGILFKLPISKTSNIYTNFHLAVVPFAGSSVGVVTDTAQFRDYRFAYGWEGKVETAINLGEFAMLGMTYSYYFIHAFDNTGKNESLYGTLGNNFISIIKPRITVQIYKNLSLGFEHSIYLNDHYQSNFPSLHSTQTEQRIFLMLYWEDPQRRGHYNL
jgi:Domain of unknown function (DUF3943)